MSVHTMVFHRVHAARADVARIGRHAGWINNAFLVGGVIVTLLAVMRRFASPRYARRFATARPETATTS